MDSSKPVFLALVGILSALWRQYQIRTFPTTFQQDAWTGWLSWTLLYFGFRVYTSNRQALVEASESTSKAHDGFWSEHLKVFALTVAGVVALIVQSQGVSPFVAPLVTLATLSLNAIAPPDQDATYFLGVAELKNEQTAQNTALVDQTCSRLHIRLWLPINLILFLTLAGSVSYESALISVAVTNSILFLLARTAIFTLLPRMSRINDLPRSKIDIPVDWNLLSKLSRLSVFSYTCLLGFSIPDLVAPSPIVLLNAFAQAAWWFAVLILSAARHPATATNIETVATSLDLQISSDQQLSVFLASISAIGALWHTVTSITLNHKYRNWLYLLILVPLFSKVNLGGFQQEKSSPEEGSTGLHPIESIAQQARTEFLILQDKQSKNLDQATKEYARRYGRLPPPNFDKWFELAMQHEFPLVDEFDAVMKSLEPFWGVPPLTLQTLSQNAIARIPDDLAKYEIQNHKVTVTRGDGATWVRESMAGLLPKEWAALLPNMTIGINVNDEPKVSVPRDMLDEAMGLTRSHGSHQRLAQDADRQVPWRSPRFLDIGQQDAWESMIVSCPADSPARNQFCPSNPTAESLFFIRNHTQSMDVCEHCELQNLEGFLFSPETLRLTHSLVPIWSQAKISSFNDIIFPSSYYKLRRADYVERDDPDWKRKDNKLYWVGASTGGHQTETNWKQMQRQRLALLTHNKSTEPIQLLREEESGIWKPYKSTMSEISSLFSTRVVELAPQCDKAACEAQKAAFEIGEKPFRDPAAAAYAHKFLLDVDGNGFSGRFYKLLHSKSVVLKQTLFTEWHDDRLLPWVHYIPVSTSFEELPELMRFLATTEKGEEIASRIARESREWAAKALRDIDLSLVWLRMLLEYGRLTDPSRDFS
ncbi:uncharacterized protein Z518_10902 [Rhinocladiella mackenziei CBS 650.93]|uniref:Glycosyl transferase CAP10 domain-containing protein n=1 Tax=Rhinocladiella mackenziei CBS 650.93 TaxID=1442369 RepID=A0A0D2ITC4_9EURO|nr:uncharacterized protein Z518_10902 [Rhinocladiella mackenziei CBS 650.93]KIW99974.1 hypothetical protein Z518_10902 [Rhinocladiella mackenziei CBS 650.93]